MRKKLQAASEATLTSHPPAAQPRVPQRQEQGPAPVSQTGAAFLPSFDIARVQTDFAPASDTYPWIGRISPWSAALRDKPQKGRDDPYQGILADLPRATSVTVVGRENGWLRVEVTLGGRKLEGYVSRELVQYVSPSAYELPPVEVRSKVPTLAEAFVLLKRAEYRKALQGKDFVPTQEEVAGVELAISVVEKALKYQVNRSTFSVSFVAQPGKIQVKTIEDFILFVEEVERTYPSASPSQIATEIRQLWFSDINWELLVAGRGVYSGSKAVDIETEPDPIAQKFDMKDLAPKSGGKQLDTRMGRVDIGHLMAGIDARLSGAPASYPAEHLSEKGHDDGDAALKYSTLQAASQGNVRDFTTWAGDIGQAYAEYLVDRYVKEDTSVTLASRLTAKASAEQLLGDIHGYIAVEVYRHVPPSQSPTGREHKVSNILRDMYLVDKSAKQETYLKYMEEVSGKRGAGLRAFIRERTLRFARPWFAKKAVEHRGYWSSEGWTKEGVLQNTMAEFDKLVVTHEKSAAPEESVDGVVDTLMKQLSGQVW